MSIFFTVKSLLLLAAVFGHHVGLMPPRPTREDELAYKGQLFERTVMALAHLVRVCLSAPLDTRQALMYSLDPTDIGVSIMSRPHPRNVCNPLPVACHTNAASGYLPQQLSRESCPIQPLHTIRRRGHDYRPYRCPPSVVLCHAWATLHLPGHDPARAQAHHVRPVCVRTPSELHRRRPHANWGRANRLRAGRLHGAVSAPADTNLVARAHVGGVQYVHAVVIEQSGEGRGRSDESNIQGRVETIQSASALQIPAVHFVE